LAAQWDWSAIRAWCTAQAAKAVGPDAVDDVAQEAVLRAWRHAGSCRTPQYPWGWLRTIVHHEIARAHAKTTPEPVEGVGEGGGDDPELEALVDGADLRAAIRRLDGGSRSILLLHYFRDMPVVDVAACLDMPVGTVKVKLARARAKLRASLRDDTTH
jgi:RNA polymerase sigma-70 factor, ECF subfamily